MSDTNLYTFTAKGVSKENLRASPTLAVGKAAVEAIDAGRDVVSFGAGELQNTPSQEMKDGWFAQFAIDDLRYKLSSETGKKDINKYPLGLGTAGMRETAAWKFAEDTGIEGLEAKHIAVTNGAKAALSAVLHQYDGPENRLQSE